MRREAQYRCYFVFQAAVRRIFTSRVVVLKNRKIIRKHLLRSLYQLNSRSLIIFLKKYFTVVSSWGFSDISRTATPPDRSQQFFVSSKDMEEI